MYPTIQPHQLSRQNVSYFQGYNAFLPVILHSDINCCYASIEHLHHPELAGKPLAVGGDPEARHGIVLTADYIAKKYGVKTGMALWQARQVCPDITFVSPRMDLYLRFSRMAHEIYAEYTDRQEP